MEKIIFRLSLLIVSFVLLQNRSVAQTAGPSQGFRHIVIITFKPDASPDSIKALDNVYAELAKSPLVKGFEWGVNVPQEIPLKHI